MTVSPANSPSATAAAPASKLDQAKQKRLADRLQAAKQALAALKLSATRPNDDRKAQAREKLESIRQRLQQLRMFGGSPRQIAALAKELKEAVKAYGGAGGSSAEAGVTAAESAQPAEAAPGDPAQGDVSAEPGDATQAAASAEPAAATVPAAAPGADADKPSASTASRGPENPYDKAIAAHARSVETAARAASQVQEDRDFALKARQLANQLKGAAVQAAQKARQSGKTTDAADAAEAVKAADDAEKAIGEVRQAMGGSALPAGGSVSV